jgi:D-erythronate 2-dehydrogenase
MEIIITGAAGFLGQRLARALLSDSMAFDSLLLVDAVLPASPLKNDKVRCVEMDLSKDGAATSILSDKTEIIFHLAAVVSSHAEKDFELGWKVNLDVTKQLLEACRHKNKNIRFVFASSLAVYGGDLPSVVDEATAVNPRSSYGTQKAMGELLVNDYTRKNFVDGRVLRLPTICVRPGRPNLAASSFVSSIIREPLNGEDAICPVSPELSLWLCSPNTVIKNILLAATLDGSVFGNWRTVNLPGISVSIQQMIGSLERSSGKETVSKIHFKPDESIRSIVSSWPGLLDNSRALQIGFKVDGPFDDFISQYLTDKQQQNR